MLHTDDRFLTAVSDAVSRAEAATDAEIVVVAARSSDPYRDVSAVVAATFAFATLFAVLYAPVVVPPLWVPVDVAIGAAAGWGISRLAAVQRWLIPTSRAAAAVERAARAEFVGEGVHETTQRTGILVYVSAVEGRVVVRGDVGIAGAVPDGALLPVVARLDPTDVEGFVAGLDALGALLARYLPADERSHRTELSDAPRVRT